MNADKSGQPGNVIYTKGHTIKIVGLSMIVLSIQPIALMILSGSIRFARFLSFFKMIFWFSGSRIGMTLPVFVQNSDLSIILNIIPLAFLTMLFYPVYTQVIKEKAIVVYLSMMTGLFAIELYGTYILVSFVRNAGP